MGEARHSDPDIADEYDFSRGRRGVYYERAKRGMRVVIVSDEEDAKRQGSSPSATSAPNKAELDTRDR